MGSAWSEFKEAQDDDTDTSSPIRSALSYSQEKEVGNFFYHFIIISMIFETAKLYRLRYGLYRYQRSY